MEGGASVRHRRAAGAGARRRGVRHGVGALSAGGRGSGCAGRTAGARGLARAVHLVHSACFWPGLT